MLVDQEVGVSDRGLLAGRRGSLRNLCRYWLRCLLLDWFLHLFAKSVGNQLLLGHLLVLVLTCGVIRVFGEVAVTRVVVLLLTIVSLHVVGWVIDGVFIVITACILV